MCRWLVALEFARDEEACAAGIEGADLVEAILATARFNRHLSLPVVSLTGEASTLKERIDRLLAPRRRTTSALTNSRGVLLTGAASLLVTAVTLGAIFGEQVVQALFRIAA
jgi:hypothetical protein